MADVEPGHRIPLVGAPASASPASDAAAPLTIEQRTVAALGLGGAFELASAELGFGSAAWLFVEQIAAISGDAAVAELREQLGSSFSVLDLIAKRWLDGERPERVETAPIQRALRGARRLLVIGLEARHLDAIVRDLPADVRIGLLTYRLQRVDWERVLGNFGGRVEAVSLSEFQSWAGARSALLTFVYGTRGLTMYVLSAFLRVYGSDVRTQFRDIIGWDVLGAPPEIYPRYLVESATTDLTLLVGIHER